MTLPSNEGAGKKIPRANFFGRVAGLFKRSQPPAPPVDKDEKARRYNRKSEERPGWRASDNHYEASPDGDWRELVPGDIVDVRTSGSGHIIAHVVEPQGEHLGVLIAPIIQVDDNRLHDNGTQWRVPTKYCRLIPIPPRVELPPEPPPREYPRRNILADACELYDLLKMHVPPSHGVRHKLFQLIEEQGYEWCYANPLKVCKAVLAFYDLPIDEQERILNGWTPRPNRPSASRLDPDRPTAQVRLAVNINAPLPYRRTEGSVYGEWRGEDTTHPVEVIVFANTRKDDVLARIAACMEYIDEHWSDEVTRAKPYPLEDEQ